MRLAILTWRLGVYALLAYLAYAVSLRPTWREIDEEKLAWMNHVYTSMTNYVKVHERRHRAEALADMRRWTLHTSHHTPYHRRAPALAEDVQ